MAVDTAHVGTVRRAGRPRDESRDADILEAARLELAERGYARMTMAGVAARAGAGKATVYRRWPSKADLVIDSIMCASEAALGIGDVPDTGSLRGDFARVKALASRDDAVWGALTGLISEIGHSPELREAVHERLICPRQALVRALLARAEARGETVPGADLDLIAGVPTAMIIYRLKLTGEPLDPAFLTALTEDVVIPLATGYADRDPDPA
ncbi:MAG: TetR/AcrR family transcriptional regulator [Promicromonosporaceae bacterium]|nr:TetR/AcrR family transcriptional regulator [Promicromonosporaceae bacterium]